ncbi:MAG: formylglycine-generating enzyme family protein [Deltaproteobacteria bacterium]|nr:formylglycine-generating enzyme family protein [Deltaproteobacteria bacterium]
MLFTPIKRAGKASLRKMVMQRGWWVWLGGFLVLVGWVEPEQREVQPSGVVWIPEGDFELGTDGDGVEWAHRFCLWEHDLAGEEHCVQKRFESDLPRRRVFLKRFGIDRMEVSQGDYEACVNAGACPPLGVRSQLQGSSDWPVVGVNAEGAERYCAFRGGRLPTEEEWEKAARGSADARVFPWGNAWVEGMANHGGFGLRPDGSDGFLGLAPVGWPKGNSPYGVLGMAGNVWEWTSSLPKMRDREFLAPGVEMEELRVVRGGSFLQPRISLRVSSRVWMHRKERAIDLGFRCAYDWFFEGS